MLAEAELALYQSRRFAVCVLPKVHIHTLWNRQYHTRARTHTDTRGAHTTMLNHTTCCINQQTEDVQSCLAHHNAAPSVSFDEGVREEY